MLYCLLGIAPVLEVIIMDVTAFCYLQVIMHSPSDVHIANDESNEDWTVYDGQSVTVLLNVSLFLHFDLLYMIFIMPYFRWLSPLHLP
jgi:hypothetical protein